VIGRWTPVISLALVLQQASSTGPTETAFDRMPLVAKYGILALLLLVAVAMIETIRRHGSREREVKVAALAAGCTYHDSDPTGIGDIRFPAFSHGKGTRLSNVVSHKSDTGLVSRAFDFSTYVEYTINEKQQYESEFVDYLWGVDGWGETGGSSRKGRRYSRARSGAMVKIDAYLPELVVAPANLLTRTFERIGAEDLDFESEEFNRSYDVRCRDKRFASLFLDAQMIDFILDFDREFAFETFGNYILCHGRRCEPRRMPVLAEKMGQVVALINPLVYHEYPTVAGIEYRDAVAEWNRRPGGASGYY
jgi:hypothetical protein